MSSVTPQLLERYYNGQCTSLEKEVVVLWLTKQEPELPDFSLSQSENEVDLKERLWKGLSKRIEENNGAIETPDNRVNYFKLLSRVAACLIGLMTLVYWIYGRNSGTDTLAIATYDQTVSMPKGKRGNFLLPDGTRVYLNAGSELKFPARFSNSSRTIYLSGEAFLEVTKDSARPFTVETAHTRVQVLGTKFNYRAYPGEPTASVAVQEGKVRFSELGKPGNEVILTADELGSYHAGQPIMEQGVYANRLFDWKENRLSFDNLELEEIATILERWYNVRVDITSENLKSYRYTGTYQNPSLDGLLHHLCFVMKCNYRITPKSVTIY